MSNINDIFNARLEGIASLQECSQVEEEIIEEVVEESVEVETEEVVEESVEIDEFDIIEELDEIVRESEESLIRALGVNYMNDLVLENTMYKAFEAAEMQVALDKANGSKTERLKGQVKAIWDRIVKWFKNVIDQVDSFFKAGEELVAKNRNVIPNAIKSCDVEVTMNKWKDPIAAIGNCEKIMQKVQLQSAKVMKGNVDAGKQSVLGAAGIKDVKGGVSLVKGFFVDGDAPVAQKISSLNPSIVMQYAGNRNKTMDVIKSVESKLKQTHDNVQFILKSNVKVTSEGGELGEKQQAENAVIIYNFGISVTTTMINAMLSMVKQGASNNRAVIVKAMACAGKNAAKNAGDKVKDAAKDAKQKAEDKVNDMKDKKANNGKVEVVDKEGSPVKHGFAKAGKYSVKEELALEAISFSDEESAEVLEEGFKESMSNFKSWLNKELDAVEYKKMGKINVMKINKAGSEGVAIKGFEDMNAAKKACAKLKKGWRDKNIYFEVSVLGGTYAVLALMAYDAKKQKDEKKSEKVEEAKCGAKKEACKVTESEEIVEETTEEVVEEEFSQEELDAIEVMEDVSDIEFIDEEPVTEAYVGIKDPAADIAKSYAKADMEVIDDAIEELEEGLKDSKTSFRVGTALMKKIKKIIDEKAAKSEDKEKVEREAAKKYLSALKAFKAKQGAAPVEEAKCGAKKEACATKEAKCGVKESVETTEETTEVVEESTTVQEEVIEESVVVEKETTEETTEVVEESTIITEDLFADVNFDNL